MSTLRYAMNVPLALLAGAALASNPRLFPPMEGPAHPINVIESIRAQEQGKAKVAPAKDGRLGAESPELQALRLAEEQFFGEMYGSDAAPDRADMSDAPVIDAVDAFDAGTGQWEGLSEPSIPIAKHPMVRRYVDFFSASPKGREVFMSWLKRSGRYREIIGEALRKHGLPGDLEAMVFVESGFWPTAKSSAGAVGLWQFMPATARAYGLTVSPTFDERRNPWRASDAAAQHLIDLHERLKSWDLVLAAYNYGYQNVEAKLSQTDTRDFWQLASQNVLPDETRKYVPKVQAVAMLLNNLDHFGFTGVQLDEPVRGVEFEVPPGTSLEALIRASGTSKAHFAQLNPEFLTKLVPDRGAPVTIHIPRSSLARARVMLPRLLGGAVQELPESEDPGFDWGREGGPDSGQGRLAATVVSRIEREAQVRELEQVKAEQMKTEQMKTDPAKPAQNAELILAKRERLSTEETSCESSVNSVASSELLMSLAQMPASSEPVIQSTLNLAAPSGAATMSAETAMALAFLTYQVSNGDSLSALAKRFGVSERELVLDNGIRNRSLIMRGQNLRIRDTNRTPDRPHLQYVVKRGDSLSKIAARVHDSESELAKRNNIKDPDHIRVGQVVLIPPT